jgi:hypothetical protein
MQRHMCNIHTFQVLLSSTEETSNEDQCRLEHVKLNLHIFVLNCLHLMGLQFT